MNKADFISIDPGFRYFAYSIFHEGKIVKADLIKTKSQQWDKWTNQPPSFIEIDDVIDSFNWVGKKALIEFPEIYTQTPNPNDIIKLASACGAYTSILQRKGFDVEWVKPKEWKGTVPKNIMLNRIVAKIHEDEYNNIIKPKDHNVIDAIGVGLWKIKRKTTIM